MKTMGMSESVYSYVHKVLMFKYKADDPNARNTNEIQVETDSRQDSSLNTVYEKENETLIKILCDNQIAILQKRKQAYKNFPILSAMKPEERLKLSSILLNVQASQLIELQSYDNRQKVPLFYQQFLFAGFMVQTNNEAASLYWKYVKLLSNKEHKTTENIFAKASKFAIEFLSDGDRELYIQTVQNINKLSIKIEKIILEKSEKKFDLQEDEGITPKQAMKFVNGFVPELLELMNPKNRNEALMKGFYGMQCPNCGDWKVERRMHDDQTLKCICHNCEVWFEAKTYPMCLNCRLPFFDEYLKLMEATAKENDQYHTTTNCPRCKHEVTFDKKLMAKVEIISDLN